MIPLLRLLHPLLMQLQLLRILPRRGINPLKHLPILIPTPVRTRHALQGNSLLWKLSRTLNVGSGAEIPPLITNGVNSDGLRLDTIEDFKLERLANRFDALLGLFPRHLLTQNWIILTANLIHCLLHLFQILIGQFPTGHRLARLLVLSFGKEEIVVESVINPRTNGCLGLGEGLLDCHGHYVGGCVADFEEVNVVFVRGEFYFFFFCLGSGGGFFGDCRGK
mmetsp:Transcript_13707/g.29852  ORF Transcript_13707/g.29852 Transcript_13707/m.29852 type:complete len:222 (+) Transcript_13707:1344-2009(+)